ncbi:MAG: fumarylacetoacetate hydrolase family protein [Candidatus Omnitrophota bacterium]
MINKTVALDEIKPLPPAIPSKIILVGLNYKDHARELKMKLPREPIIFLKPSTALLGMGGKILYPKIARRLDYEAELALVIGKQAKHVPESRALDYVLGFSCLNDVTARDIQKKDGQWTRSKSFDTFCPFGPWLTTGIDPDNLKVRSYLNGLLMQDSSTSNFIFPVRRIVSFVSQVMTLLPGDIISTGTPAGVGPMRVGDVIEVEIEGLGRLANPVAV